jgi:hypothetical protein
MIGIGAAVVMLAMNYPVILKCVILLLGIILLKKAIDSAKEHETSYEQYYRDRADDIKKGIVEEDVKEFFKMIGYYHISENQDFKKEFIGNDVKENGKENYKFEELKPVIEYLESGKVVIVGLKLHSEPIVKNEKSKKNETGYGHALIAYDYDVDLINNTIIFKVYDCEFPDERNRTLDLKIFPKVEDDKIENVIEYRYRSRVEFGSTIIKGDNYSTTSILAFMDEDCNRLFPAKSDNTDSE